MTIALTKQPAARSGVFAIGGDLPVHRLGFGAMRLTGKGIWGEPSDPQECIAVLRRAVELGITLIDTADSYGPKVSERFNSTESIPGWRLRIRSVRCSISSAKAKSATSDYRK